MKNVLVVANFNAGRKKAISYKKKVQKFLLKNALNFKFIAIDDLQLLELAEYDTIIAMGGDGTVSKTASFAIENDKTLGIIPCGTANLLAEKLGISQDIDKALRVLSSGQENYIDVVRLNGVPSVLRFGVGYDSDIICKTPQSLKNRFGYFAYFVAGILFALRLKTRSYRLVFNGKEVTAKASGIIVANAPNMYRNWISIGKNSKLDDGLLEIFVLKTTNPILFFIELLNITFGCFVNSYRAEYYKAEKVSIYSEWMSSHVDGEKKNFQDNVEFEVLPSALRVIS